MARRTPQTKHRDEELEKRSASFAEGLNLLAIALCANSVRVIQERYGVTDLRETLGRSAEVCLDFVSWLRARGGRGRDGVELAGAEEAFAELAQMFQDRAILEPERADGLRQAIRRASSAFGIELPAHPMGSHGAVCEYHGSVCPPAEPELTLKKGGR